MKTNRHPVKLCHNAGENRRILGIDEAGRGCVMGPLCMAGVTVSNRVDDTMLREWGCRDSKTFGSGPNAVKTRKIISAKIKARFHWKIEVIPSSVIDAYVSQKKLNVLEVEYAQKIVDQSDFEHAILDGEGIFKSLQRYNITAINKADEHYTCVSAASILAKDRRDSELKIIFSRLNFPENLPGGGYANSVTLALLMNYHKQYGRLPDDYRFSYKWKTLIRNVETSNL